MAVVHPPDGGAKALSGLRRSHSTTKFGTKITGSFRTSVSASKIQDIYQHDLRVVSDSESSSTPSSPSNVHSEPIDICAPVKQAPNFPLSDHFNPATDFALPCYNGPTYFSPSEDLEAPPSPGGLGDSYTVSPNDNNTSVGTSRPDSPTLIERADDDTAIKAQPSRHVDYLSHNWKEEEIWKSWQYIVSKRGEYQNSARLENASWRTWMKAKNNLKTVNAETLNWLKDCDVTWLYGPLQTGTDNIIPPRTGNSIELTKSNSFLNKKPILKKRSMSEMMLQRSLSTSSLVKQAAASVQAQQLHGIRRPSRPQFGRANTDVATFRLSHHLLSPKNSLTQSTNSSSLSSPSVERKHIHFNEQVQQCIAVDVKGDGDDDDSSWRYQNDSDSDDGGIMMKRSFSKKRPILKRRGSGSKNGPESKTIAMLPATQLKYRADTPEPPERSTAMKHSYRSPAISPSSSQETLRPSKASRKFVFADDDSDEDEDDEDERETQPVSASGGLKRTSSSGGLAAEGSGMRRTASGMLMPYDEGEPTTENGGIVGRVLDTVNTARDIAHVIWNVGWRK